jgi:hypothetical protein
LGQLSRDHHLLKGDGRLSVIALQGSAVAADKAAVGVGGVHGRRGVGGLITPPGSDVGPRSLPAGLSGGGQLGDSLLVALLAGGRLGFQLGLGLLQPGQPLGPASHRPRQFVATGGAVLAVLGPIRLGGFGEQLGDLGLEVGVGAVGGRGGVGLDLGAVQGDQPQADHPGGRAQLQRLDQQPGQGLFVADPEPGDGHMIRGRVGGQDSEGDVFLAAPLDLAGRTDPGAVAVQQYGQEHPGLIRGPAVAIGPIGLEERAKVELVDDVEHEPGQVVSWQPVAQVWWEQKGLVAVAGTEVVGHGRSYAIGLPCYPRYRPA